MFTQFDVEFNQMLDAQLAIVYQFPDDLESGYQTIVLRDKLIADNLFNKTYQSHLSRLKYCDTNSVTGRQGISNMGRNIIAKLILFIPTGS